MLKPSLEVLEDRTMPSNFGVLPPEISSALMVSGPGSAPMLAAAAVWDSLAGELISAATPYVAWMSATAAQAEAAASQTQAAASAFETAFASTVPPPVIAANRTLLASLVATNVFGQNTPAIAMAEFQYMEMWAQDVAAMAGYADAALASPSSGVVPAAADEVSAALAALFGAHAEMYQGLSSQAAAFHEQLSQALNAASGQYASTESANPGATG